MNMYTTASTDQPESRIGKCGDINFGLEYDFPSETLKLKIIQVWHRPLILEPIGSVHTY